jgi:hypothetical protein
MPQLDKLESKIVYIQFGMEFYSLDMDCTRMQNLSLR